MAKRAVKEAAEQTAQTDQDNGSVEITNQHGESTGLTISSTTQKPANADEIAERMKRIERLSKVEVDDVPNITSQYWEPVKGDSIRGIFLGIRVLKKKDADADEGYRSLPAVAIETLEGERLSAAMQIVDTFFTRVPLNSAVYVECIESRSGEMKRFDIKVLE